MSSHRKRTTEEDDLEEIRKGFEKFDVNGTGIINPAELLEAMDAMNIKEKNPFIYEIIESLNSEKEIRKKGGVELEELVTYVYNKVNDTETNIGLRQIHEVINDSLNVACSTCNEISIINLCQDVILDTLKTGNILVFAKAPCVSQRLYTEGRDVIT